MSWFFVGTQDSVILNHETILNNNTSLAKKTWNVEGRWEKCRCDKQDKAHWFFLRGVWWSILGVFTAFSITAQFYGAQILSSCAQCYSSKRKTKRKLRGKDHLKLCLSENFLAICKNNNKQQQQDAKLQHITMTDAFFMPPQVFPKPIYKLL